MARCIIILKKWVHHHQNYFVLIKYNSRTQPKKPPKHSVSCRGLCDISVMDTGNGERVRQGRRGIRDAAGTEKRMQNTPSSHTSTHPPINTLRSCLTRTCRQNLWQTQNARTQRYTLLSITSDSYMTFLRNRLRTCVYLDLRVIRACVCLCVHVCVCGWGVCVISPTGRLCSWTPFCHLDTSQCKWVLECVCVSEGVCVYEHLA